MRWTGHGNKSNVCRVLVGKPKEKKDLDIGGRIILRWILQK
jgi:hypothetical protein